MAAELNKVVWHLNQIQIVPNVLVDFVALLNDIGDVLALHVMVNELLNVLLFFPLSFYLQVRKVFSPINPISNRPLDFEHYRYQNFLYHF